MTVTNNRVHKDGTRSLEMQGLFHTLTFMPTMSDYDPLLVQIERGTETSCALLDQDDIDALHEFLSHYLTKEF